MKSIKNQLFKLSVLGALIFTSCMEKTGNSDTAEPKQPKFEANWESIKANYKDPEWFNKTKFGIFIHWGAYT
ncbi:alpha-L-fucosidase, partial [Flavivirga rizhaonensis]